MNKITKASIATGAAILLLMGGGGTLAYWNASADAGSATINTGKLAVTVDPLAGATTGWSVTNGATTLTNVAPASYVAVPGDVITYTRVVTLDAAGTNLRFSVAPAFSAANTHANAELQAVLDAATITVTPLTGGTGAMTHSSGNVYNLTTAGTIKAEVKMVLNWAFGATAQNGSQSQTVPLNTIQVAVTQVAH